MVTCIVLLRRWRNADCGWNASPERSASNDCSAELGTRRCLRGGRCERGETAGSPSDRRLLPEATTSGTPRGAGVSTEFKNCDHREPNTPAVETWKLPMCSVSFCFSPKASLFRLATHPRSHFVADPSSCGINWHKRVQSPLARSPETGASPMQLNCG